MTKEETIQVLQSIEARAADFPNMTACDWVAIASAKRHLTNSLEVKEVKEEPVTEDLEEAARKVGQKYFPDEYNIWARPNYEAEKAECAFKAGVQWQKAQTIEKACDAYCKICGHYSHETPNHICRQACDCYNDFRNYIKGE